MRIWMREPQAEAHIEAEPETAISARYLAQALKVLGGVAEAQEVADAAREAPEGEAEVAEAEPEAQAEAKEKHQASFRLARPR